MDPETEITQPDLIDPETPVTDEAPPADAPPPEDPAVAEEAAIEAALEAAAREDGLPAKEADEPEPEADPVADEPPADEPKPEAEPEPELTDEQKDEADAKALGFKNMKATTEFKAMRAELRELRPLKEQIATYQAPAEKWGQLTTYFEEKAITPDQFGQAMTVVAAFNATDIGIKRQARDILVQELKVLNSQIGEEGAGYDPLAEDANRDLAEAVDAADLPRERALEIARLRHESRHNETLRQRQTETSQREMQAVAARQQAIADLNAIGDEYARLDPQYAQKSAMITPILKPIFADLPPERWAARFKEAYAAIGALPAAAPPPAGPRRPAPLANQPLRAASSNANMAAAIKTEEDAIEAALRKAAELDGVAY